MSEQKAIDGYEKIVKGYDRMMLDSIQTYFYGYSDFFNFGCWEEGIKTQKEACENLIEKLLSFIPEKQGNILDVACGLGASTRHLLRYYRPEDIVAINISDLQLTRARVNAPGCTFLVMNATDLEFDDASFDSVICVEAALHFNTRNKFLNEAYRILRPGGRLVMCDIMFHRMNSFAAKHFHIPAANFLESPGGYRQQLLAAGFPRVEVFDATEACWGGFSRHLKRWPHQERQAGNLNFWNYVKALKDCGVARVSFRRSVHYYVLISAQKAAS